MTDAILLQATLAAADLSGAVVRGADFHGTTGLGFTAAQLYSTASYQDGDLSGVGLSGNDLSGWDLTAMNLAQADFEETTLLGTDLRRAIVRGADFQSTTRFGFTRAQLYATASYETGDLMGIGLRDNNLSGWDFAGQDLTGADFAGSALLGTGFGGAVVRGANFWDTTRLGFSSAQLYSTASYQTGDLTGVALGDNDLSGWDLAGKNLMHASLWNAVLAGTDLGLADLRGATLFESQVRAGARTAGTIWPDGRIEGLTLAAGARLTVHDYNGQPGIPITVETLLEVDPAAAVRMVFEDDVWGSTISFRPDVAVVLDGSLELAFGDATRPADLIGATFDLFDWDGATVTGSFATVATGAAAVWDTSELYTTGAVTLVWAVPEPTAVVLLGIGAGLLLVPRRRARLPTEAGAG